MNTHAIPDQPLSTEPLATPTVAQAKRRFNWPTRILIAYMVFEIVFRSTSVLVPWREWQKELELDRFPKRLPTVQERADAPDQVGNRLWQSADSVWVYFRPWPSEETRPAIDSWEKAGKYSYAWLNLRLAFIENLTGFRQQWPMFSPDVADRKYLTRARLIYDDGTTYIARHHGDPEDLTRYFRLNQEKILDHELRVREDREDECWAWCHMLSNRSHQSPEGASLVRIRLFFVRVNLPPPDVDPYLWLKERNEKPDEIYPDFYQYEVDAKKGRLLEEK